MTEQEMITVRKLCVETATKLVLELQNTRAYGSKTVVEVAKELEIFILGKQGE